MNLSKLTPAVLGILLTALPIHVASAEGGTDGGGGGAMVKFDKSGKKIIDAEFIDLWEGQNLKRRWEVPSPYILNIPYSNKPVQEQIDGAIAKLRDIDPLFAERVEQDLKFVQDRSHWNELPAHITLPLPKDAHLDYQASDRTPLGMFYFDEELNQLSVKPEIFLKLKNNTNIAAAFTHEAIYKTMRDMELVNADSTEVRMINACLYATNDCFGLRFAKLQPTAGSEFYSCSSKFERDVPLLLKPTRPTSGWQYYVGSIQLSHLGSATYKTPYVLNFTLAREDGARTFEGENGGIMNRAFEIYIRRWKGYIFKIISNEYPKGDDRRVSAEVESQNLVRITLPASQNLWNNEVTPKQIFECERIH